MSGTERVHTYAFDVRVREQCEALVRHCAERFGSLDVLVNNSGLAVPETVEEITDEGWETVLPDEPEGRDVARPRGAALGWRRRSSATSSTSRRRRASTATPTCPRTAPRSGGSWASPESVRDHARKTGANVRVFNLCPAGLVDVEHTAPDAPPRPGFVHVSNMAKTLLYVLSLDRDAWLEEDHIPVNFLYKKKKKKKKNFFFFF